MIRSLPLLAAALIVAPAAAGAVTYNAGTTSIVVRPSVYNQATALGATFATLGNATVTQSNSDLGFTIALPVTASDFTVGGPITGGETVSHAGSGVELAINGTRIDFTNFVINEGTGAITADVTVDGAVYSTGTNVLNFTTPLTITSIGDLATPSLVGIAQPAADALNQYLDISDALGFEVARVSTVLTAAAVPEPAMFALFGLSAVALGFARRRTA